MDDKMREKLQKFEMEKCSFQGLLNKYEATDVRCV